MRKKDKPATTPTVSQVINRKLVDESLVLCKRYRELKSASPNGTPETVKLNDQIWALWRRVDAHHKTRGFLPRTKSQVIKSVFKTIFQNQTIPTAFREVLENLILTIK